MFLTIWVSRVKAKLKKIILQAEEIHHDKDQLIFLESRHTLSELNQIFQQLKNHPRDQEVSVENLQVFIDFLRTRWERIALTDADYPYVLSHANLICIRIALKLGDFLKKSYVELLMPGAELSKHERQALEIELENFTLKHQESRIALSGDYGWNKLQVALCEGIETKQQLADVLAMYPKDCWDAYLKLFSLETLKKLLLNEAEFSASVHDPKLFSKGTEQQAIIEAVLFYHYYLRRLTARAQDKNSILGFSFWSYDKATKNKEANLCYQYFLLGGTIKGFNLYINNIAHAQFKGALMQGDLGELTSEISKQSNLAQSEPEKASRVSYG